MRRALPIVVFAIAMFAVACSEQSAQVSVQTSMTSLAHAVRAADEIATPAYREAGVRSRAIVLREREADESITQEQGMQRFLSLMESWDSLASVLIAIQRSLLAGQGALNAWIAGDTLTDVQLRDLSGFCSGVGTSINEMVTLMGELELDVPDAIEAAAPSIGTVCTLAGNYIVGLTTRGE